MSGFGLEIPWLGHKLQVTGTVTGGRPASRTGHPDSWTPAEDPELGQVEVLLVRGGRTRRLGDRLVETLLMDPTFLEKVQVTLERVRADAYAEGDWS